jgi:hypothetical protein
VEETLFPYNSNSDSGIVNELVHIKKDQSIYCWCSGIADGKKVNDWISRSGVFCWTKNLPYSWYVRYFGSIYI